MQNVDKLTKFLYKNLMKIKCGHFLEAYDKNQLDIFDDDNLDGDFFSSSNYFDIFDAFEYKNNKESDAVDFFIKLKNKVVTYYKKIYKNKLKNFYEKFQLKTNDAFLSFDFFRIDKIKKEIEFIVIKPSIFNGIESHFLKTWDKKRQSGNIFALNFINDNEKNDINKFLKTGWMPFNQEILKGNCKNDLTSIALLIPELWQNSKKTNAYELLFLMQKLHNKYPDYKIIAKLPLINKTLKPYSFTTLEYIFDVKNKLINTIYHSIFKWSNNLINDFKNISKNKKFILPYYQSKFPTNKICFICNQHKAQEKISQEYNIDLVENILANYPDKIAMIDFETINDPLPDTDFYLPYDKIVVQISMHLLENGKILDHKEYITKDLSKKELQKIYDILVFAIDNNYQLCAYYKSFETSAIKTIEKVLSKSKISDKYHMESSTISSNDDKLYILDLMDFFNKKNKKPPISLYRFGNSSSIKKTIEFYSGNNNPYKNLPINNGFKAMKKLYKIIVEKNHENKEKLIKKLYNYCKQDTLTMVNIYNQILNIRNKIQKKPEKTQKILSELDIK